MIESESATPTPVALDEGREPIPRLVVWGIAMLVLAVLYVVFSLGIWSLEEPPAVPAVEGREDAATIRQQTEEHARRRLATYGWTDEERGLVHIPLPRAIERYLEAHAAGENGAPGDGTPSEDER